MIPDSSSRHPAIFGRWMAGPWLAWAMCLLVVLLALAGLALSLSAPAAAHDLWSIVNQALGAAFAIAFGVVGALIFGSQPRNVIGRLLIVIGLSLGLGTVLPAAVSGTVTSAADPSPQLLLVSWFVSWSWWLLMGPLLLILLLFPAGRLLSRRWRWVAGLLAVCFGAFLFVATFSAHIGTPDGASHLRNPLGFLPEAALPIFLAPFQALLLAAVFTCTAAIFVRYRRAAAVEREQIKWFLYACAVFLLAFAGALFVDHAQVNAYTAVFDLALLGLPLSIGVAILRYRLWDIDVIIRRTLVYAVLTALLAVAYFGSVVVLQNFIGALTGQRQTALVTVFSTLMIAALFVPLRRRVQSIIDRRFYRRKYDAARTLAAFGSALRDETNLDQHTTPITAVVDEALQPDSVTLWLWPAADGQVDQPSRP